MASSARPAPLGILALFTTSLAHGQTTPARAPPERASVRARDAGEPLRQATEDFRAGRYAAARQLFDRVLATQPRVPGRATIAFNAAVSSYALEDYADALRRFDAVSQEAPELAALARVNAGFAALRSGDLEAAEARAQLSAPSSEDVEERRRALLAELAEVRQANAEQELGQHIDAGFAAVSRQQWELARDHFSRALALRAGGADDLADAHYGLGLVAAELGESSQAEDHFEQSLRHRPGDGRTLLALARAAEDGADRQRAAAAYETALTLPLGQEQAEDAQRSLFRLYPLPESGPAALVSLGFGADGNATQSGTGDVLTSSGEAQSSAFVSALVDVGLVLRASRHSAFGLNYSGDLLALLNPSVDDLSLQAHELVARWHWAPIPSVRLRLDAGAAYVLTGLDPVRAFEWDGVLTLAADLDTGARSRARLQLGERLVRASELSYLDGHRLHALASELWSLGAWEPSLHASLRYNAAGVEEVDLPGDAFAACSPNCDRGQYRNPYSYWSPGVGAGLSWQATSSLRLYTLVRADYRGYLEESAIPSFRASQKTRQDLRFRGQLGGELALDAAGRFRLTLDQTLVVNRSNVAFDATDPDHQYDYGDRNFLQPTTELGISASLP